MAVDQTKRKRGRRFVLSRVFLVVGMLCGFDAALEAGELLPSGNSQIRAPLGSSEIVITTTERLAGAIHSLTWNDKEFIDSTDHGRQLQSASNFDFNGPMIPETFNPTEAGSVADGAGPTSTSRLLHLIASRNRLQTTTQMAFWLRPDGQSAGHPARNQTALSNHTLTKRVQIGLAGLPQVIQYDVTFGLPIDEMHQFAQFEVVTGYMPFDFELFRTFNLETEVVEPLSAGPGEQRHPVIFSTTDDRYAMACVSSREAFGAGWSGPGYGRFRFDRAKVVKWNCVYRYRNSTGVEPGDYSFRCFVLVGDLAIVLEGLKELNERGLLSRPVDRP
ncbi:hypothetical protein [Rubinisphaera margarita]|uniref:hypothetical protein n=1 Tax=Rubinisphaera margarita TaxID=2909586 RepID=UPI001EE93EB3|nr:hypothetical protein [Rubinisphaera margarita]MCG6154531.1 hypothetical protein [Rubinisphaera margarita]